MRDQLTPLYRNQAGQYNIIHLATHAFIDDEDPMHSRLAFTSRTDSIEDSYLYAHDTYTVRLMNDFYDFLSQGYAKDEALRQAKIKFLTEAPEQALHPFYWGGFGVIGIAALWLHPPPIWEQKVRHIGMGLLIAMIISTLLFAKYNRKKVLKEGQLGLTAEIYLPKA